MIKCPNCQTSLNDGAAFCKHCGTKINASPSPAAYTAPVAPVQNATPTGVRKLHCPNCKSYNLTINTESSVTGGLTTHHGGMSTTSFSNTHRNYWFCSDCGTKFRNIQNLEEEIKKYKSAPIILGIFAAIFWIVAIWLIATVSDRVLGFLFYGYIFGALLAAIIFTIFVFVNISRGKKMQAELDYLKTHCFN